MDHRAGRHQPDLAGGRALVHTCGNETKLLEHLIATGADCLELDPGTDLVACKAATRGRTAVLGMLDPIQVLLKGSTLDVRRHTLAILRIMAPGGGFILGPGCALPPDTPVANIHEVMECTRTAGVYARGSVALPKLDNP